MGVACGHINAFGHFPFSHQRKSVLKACRAGMSWENTAISLYPVNYPVHMRETKAISFVCQHENRQISISRHLSSL